MDPSDDCQDIFVPATTEHYEEMNRDYPWKLWVPKKNNFEFVYEPPDLHMATNNNNADIFHLLVKIEGFRAEEVSVKTAREMITIECSRPEKFFDGGWESCHIVRRIPVPEGVNLEKISEWVSNEILTILAPIDHDDCKPIDKPHKRNKAKQQRNSQDQQQKQTQNHKTVQLPNQDYDQSSLEAVFKELSIRPSCSSWDDTANLFNFFYDAQTSKNNESINYMNFMNGLSDEESPDTSQEYSEDSYDLVANQHDKSECSENANDFAAD